MVVLISIEPCRRVTLSRINDVLRIAGDRLQPVHDVSWAIHALTSRFADAHLRNLHRLRETRYRLSVLAHEPGYLFTSKCVHLSPVSCCQANASAHLLRDAGADLCT